MFGECLQKHLIFCLKYICTGAIVTAQAAIDEEPEADKTRRKSQPHTAASRIVENRMEKLRKIIEKADKAKAKIQKRKMEWNEL